MNKLRTDLKALKRLKCIIQENMPCLDISNGFGQPWDRRKRPLGL